MKTIKTLFLLCMALCFASSCKKEDDMTLIQKTILENTDIRQIEVSDAWEVTIVADDNTYVELEYSVYLEERIKVQLEGTKLEFSISGSSYPTTNVVYRATVHVKQLEKLEADDAAEIQCNGSFSCQHIEIGLSDAAQCHGLIFSGENCEIEMKEAALMAGFQFIGNNCTAVLADASQYSGQIQANEQFEIELTDASRFVNKGGVTNKVVIKLQSACLLNMVETQVREVQVNLSNGSEATVWVEELLEGTLSGGSTLFYKGNPQKNLDCSEGSEIIPL